MKDSTRLGVISLVDDDRESQDLCPVCLKDELDFHQPDLAKPSRILVVCSACHTWFIEDGQGERRPVAFLAS